MKRSKEHCRLFAALRGVAPQKCDAVVRAVLREMELDTPVTCLKLAKQLSGGFYKRLPRALRG